MSDFEGARYQIRARLLDCDRSVSIPTGAVEVTRIPRRKSVCLLLDSGESADILAWFTSEEAAAKFVKFMDKFAVTN